jgi:nicotinamidase/pyrazinamidase
MRTERAVILIVDMQIDFCPGGSLAVAEGDTIIPLINRYIELFRTGGVPVIASRDWHPPVSDHFSQYGGLWPPHCIQGSAGAGFPPALRLPDDVTVVSKGSDPHRDDYSAMQATLASGLSLTEQLKKTGLTHLYLCGLATDYCVKWSALDALQEGFEVTVLMDAVKGVELSPGDSLRALEEIVGAGGELADLALIEKRLASLAGQ